MILIIACNSQKDNIAPGDMLGLQAPLITLINVSSFGISIRWQSSLPADTYLT